jgi:hypothetical protein
MNSRTLIAMFVATFSATLALANTAAMAAKPGGGGTTDFCATSGLDFPAFTYRQLSGKEQQIYVADADGKCSRLVYKSSSNAGSFGAAAFSYPVAGTTNNVGRVVWPDGNAIWAINFTVTGTSIQVGPKFKVYEGLLNALDLSRDGSTLYVSGYSGSFPAIKAVTIATSSTSDLYVGAIEGSFFFTVEASDDAVYADLSLPANTGHELLRVDLPCVEPCAEVLAANMAPVYPAVNSTGSIVAYSDYLVGSNNCWQLKYLDVSGVTPTQVFAGGQPRYGTRSSWYGNKVLTNGRKSPDGSGRCADTGMVTQVDPSTGAETPLLRGYDPDGR